MIYSQHDDIQILTNHVQTAVRKLGQHLYEFDSIAVRGTSGLLVGSPVAMMLNKSLVVVRKKDESRHSSSAVELVGKSIGTRVLFLDDFVSTGETRKAVLDAISKRTKGTADLVGQYMYNWWDSSVEAEKGELEFFSTSLKEPNDEQDEAVW